MIEGRERQVRSAHGKTIFAEYGKCLRRCDLMNNVQIDVKNRRCVCGLFDHDMIRPYFLEQRAWVAQILASVLDSRARCFARCCGTARSPPQDSIGYLEAGACSRLDDIDACTATAETLAIRLDGDSDFTLRVFSDRSTVQFKAAQRQVNARYVLQRLKGCGDWAISMSRIVSSVDSRVSGMPVILETTSAITSSSTTPSVCRDFSRQSRVIESFFFRFK